MNVTEEVAKAIVGAMKGLGQDDAGQLWAGMDEREQTKYRQAALMAIETYVAVVAMPLEVRKDID